MRRAGGDVVVIAGGIGLAPLRPVALARARSPRATTARSSLLYGARTPEDLLYTAQLDEWRDAVDVEVTVDTAGGDWAGRVGVVPKLIAARALPSARRRRHSSAGRRS